MRIAHVLRRLSFDDWGGTEQVVWNIAKAQEAAGHEVRLFATTALWGGLAAKNAENAKPLCSLRSLWLGNKQYAETVDGIEIVRFKPIYPWWPMPKALVDELDRKGGNRTRQEGRQPLCAGTRACALRMEARRDPLPCDGAYCRIVFKSWSSEFELEKGTIPLSNSILQLQLSSCSSRRTGAVHYFSARWWSQCA